MKELMTVPKAPNFFKSKSRTFSFDNTAAFVNERIATPQVKPRVLESKVSEHQEFYNLSDGFKKIFGEDRQDRKIIIPVVGYGGHRRGERS